ncbi:hypothetical protein MGG_15379 [Pyricularia oryzae 70-15]|uniref:Uncharacterized protein n=1 Tax=Pyricularia oryzae (strain 70-15 / ATCC MYA-4617 / FGSC 8958) TaxID=242507 RepID=G4NFQ4_PYRO7|nr:uncharacterized protein MGG_15379 [Pyricularia oryzae 70-15]EHA46861.1 hypothetical protein MGG_15379 [Pyricularia oryzae 70-15]KAI7921686.1 hypothetical protein M0657_006001 [Pyricularia oryzae]KAI7926139.1 hypothetical protein M9X92_002884 [Pyricularia oryzae]
MSCLSKKKGLRCPVVKHGLYLFRKRGWWCFQDKQPNHSITSQNNHCLACLLFPPVCFSRLCLRLQRHNVRGEKVAMLRKTKFLGREQWRRTYFSFSPQLQFTDGKSGQNLQVGTKKGKRISKPQSHCNMEKEPLHFKSPHRQRNTVPSPGVSPAS